MSQQREEVDNLNLGDLRSGEFPAVIGRSSRDGVRRGTLQAFKQALNDLIKRSPELQPAKTSGRIIPSSTARKESPE